MYTGGAYSIDESPESQSFCAEADELIRSLGIDSERVSKLAEFNDDGKSFKWIAAYIERYL